MGSDPLTEGFIVLHQVSEESSGEIDSVRVEPDGTFQIRLPHVPDPGGRSEIFFASVEYRGLLYFGPAVTEAVQLDSLYRIQAYDTLSVPPEGARIPVAARSLFLEKAEDGWAATDVFQLRVEGDRTLYSPGEKVVWSYPMPPSGVDFQVGQADMAPDAVRFQDNQVELYSPLPPGDRYLMIHYRILEGGFVLPMPGTTDEMVILVREPAPDAVFPPLTPLSSVEMEPGNTYRRYAAENLVDSEIRGELAPEPWTLPAEWFGLMVGGLLGAAGIFGYRYRGKRLPGRKSSEKTLSREQLLRAIAVLDEDFQSQGDSSAQAKERYEKRRRKLIEILKRGS